MRQRVFTKSPVQENCTPGSVRGLSGNRQSYRDLRCFFSDGLLTDSRSRREELAGVTHRPPPIIKNSSAPKFRSETSHEPFNQERKS